MTTRSGWNRLVTSSLRDRARLADDLEARPPIEHGDKALADDLVVIHDHHRQRPWGCLFGRHEPLSLIPCSRSEA